MAIADTIATMRTNLLARYETITILLADLERADACGVQVNPGAKPDTKTDGGTTVAHYQHKMGLYKEMEAIEKRLMELNKLEDTLDDSYGKPFEIQTQVRPA